MQTAVIIGPIAVTTEYWEESQSDGTRETGCRVQVRLVRVTPAPIPPPVPRRDAVFWVIEEPIWRADLFSVVGGVEDYDAAHFHPTFAGLVPCEREHDPAINRDPDGWIARRLADLPAMLAEAGHASLAAELDPDQVRQAMPAILATIRTTMAYRAVPSGTTNG